MAEDSAASTVVEPRPIIAEQERPQLNGSDFSQTIQPLQSSSSQFPPASLPANPPSVGTLSIPTYPPLSSSLPGVVAPVVPSFRPAMLPVGIAAPQFSPVVNSNLPIVSVPPPGVISASVPGLANGVGSVAASIPLSSMIPYQVSPVQPPNPAMGQYSLLPNSFMAMPPAPQGTIPPHGIPRYPSPYVTMMRPGFPARPPLPVGLMPAFPRHPIPGIRTPIIPPVRPAMVPSVTPAEKPQTTVYVGKIAPTAGNDFMLSILQLCGPVKSWKRAQDPSNGTLKGFGFCEFESAEGVLRALRLLSKFSIDGQELVLNVNQATREYLERYIEKKTENSKKLEKIDEEEAEKKEEGTVDGEEVVQRMLSRESKGIDDNSENKENKDNSSFGIVTKGEKEIDQELLEKLADMVEERSKAKPLPPPPTQNEISFSKSASMDTKPRDGEDVEVTRNDAVEDKKGSEASGNKVSGDQDKVQAISPEKSRRHDRSSRERDRERDVKREKERELERYERERERERARRERDLELRIREAELLYKDRLKDWEIREREREYQHQYEKEKEKEMQHLRRREIREQEKYSDDEEDDSRKRRRRLEERRRKRLREKEDDVTDRLKEKEEEIAETKKRAEEKESENVLPNFETDRIQEVALAEENSGNRNCSSAPNAFGGSELSWILQTDNSIMGGGKVEESMLAAEPPSIGTAARKLGFGLVGSGKRTTVISVFHEEDDDEEQKDKKMKPLVPIDYSTEEMQAVHATDADIAQLDLFAAAEFAKKISSANPKEERHESDRDRSRRSHDRSSRRDRDRYNDDGNHARDVSVDRIERYMHRQYGHDKPKTSESKKLLDAKQLIDTIPRTKEELFSYDINWSIYDTHHLHERMRPWVAKKITEFLGEEEATLVDYILSSTNEHVKGTQMLQLLQPILDEEAEMFVLKMWRMLIFEIKKVEAGLTARLKS